VSASIPSDLRSIVEAGVRAPSADNRHCFEVSASPDGILLFGSAAYLNGPFHRKILSLISFGAVVENMTIRAARLGYQANISWLPHRSSPALIADLRLTRSEPVETARDQAIAGRHTNRRVVFSGPRLSDVALRELKELVHGIDGVTLDFFDLGTRRAALLRLVEIAEAERFNTRTLHEDLFSSVRFDAGWHAGTDEGLPPAALAVEPGARWMFAQLRHWGLMNALRHFGIHRALGFRAAYLPCRLAPHRGVLTTSLPLERGAVAVGMALERVWLEAERRGLAFQPFAASSLLALPEYREVPVKTGERLRAGCKALTPDTPLMVFRLGRAPQPAIRTGRPHVEAYLRDE